MSYGLFKVSQGGVQDCTTVGMTYFRAIIGLIYKMFKYGKNERDFENWTEFIFLFSERCNYLATV